MDSEVSYSSRTAHRTTRPLEEQVIKMKQQTCGANEPCCLFILFYFGPVSSALHTCTLSIFRRRTSCFICMYVCTDYNTIQYNTIHSCLFRAMRMKQLLRYRDTCICSWPARCTRVYKNYICILACLCMYVVYTKPILHSYVNINFFFFFFPVYLISSTSHTQPPTQMHTFA